MELIFWKDEKIIFLAKKSIFLAILVPKLYASKVLTCIAIYHFCCIKKKKKKLIVIVIV